MALHFEDKFYIYLSLKRLT